MRYVIYIDVFLAVNMIMDLILLKVTAHFVKPQTTFFRCVLGAVVGSLLGSGSLLLSYDNMLLHTLFTYIFISAAMVLVSYGRSSVKTFLLRVGWLYLVTIIFGGAMNMIYSYTYLGYMVQGVLSSMYANPLNIGKLIVFTAIAYLVLSGLTELWRRRSRQEQYVRVVLKLKEQSTELTGLIDTGNSLICPYSGKPVHIVACDAVDTLLEGVNIYEERYRLVPFNSLGKSNGLIEVIECAELLVYEQAYCQVGEAMDEEKKEHRLIYCEDKPAVGLYKGSLSSAGEYEMLLHSTVKELR